MKHILPKDVNSAELSDLIDLYIIGFKAKRNREIMRSKFIDGLTYEQVAEKYGISVQSAKHIVYKCLEKISSFI